MKNKILAKICPVIITLLILSTIIQVQATDGWDEDFEGETIASLEIDNWVFKAWTWNGAIYNESIDHGFNVTNGILRAPSYQYFGDNEGNMSVAFHNNTVAYGTWSFDWAPAASPTASITFDYISIIANPCENLSALNLPLDDEAWGTYYSVVITQNIAGGIQRIELEKQEAAPRTYTTLGNYDLTPPVMGPIHIEVTRDSQGQFKVYYDTEEIISATDNDITTSEYFLFTSRVGDTGIDNITVDDGPVGSPGIPGFTVGFVICTVTPTVIVLVIVRKRVKFKKGYTNED